MDQSRRNILKFVAAAPLALTFGFAGEALMRFAKPSMKPLGLFDSSDQPGCAIQPVFVQRDFPEPWTCIPFLFPLKITEFNPEQQEICKIPGFIIRLPCGEFVAYSRICPARGCVINYVREHLNECRCHPCSGIEQKCCCITGLTNPALICPCDGSTFDLARDAFNCVSRRSCTYYESW
jgi:Rieske Fe-S protein